jgi:hypothetical protein
MADDPIRIWDMPGYQLAQPNIRRCRKSCPGVTLFCNLRTSVPLQTWSYKNHVHVPFCQYKSCPRVTWSTKNLTWDSLWQTAGLRGEYKRLRYHKYAFNIHGSVHRKNILIYEGDSNENLKSAIKIRNTARLLCKLTTVLLMGWRVADRWQYDARM